MKNDFDFQMFLRVYDPQALRQAALAHDDTPPDQTFMTTEEEVDIASCLVMLLDPGYLDGCSVDSSRAARAEFGSDGDFEFVMCLSVDNPDLLRAAALKHVDARMDDTFLSEDGTVNVEASLVMMLDPGSLPGCSIHSSSAPAVYEGEGEEEGVGMAPGC